MEKNKEKSKAVSSGLKNSVVADPKSTPPKNPIPKAKSLHLTSVKPFFFFFPTCKKPDTLKQETQL